MQTNLPTITIIIPTYNSENYLENCLHSVIYQAYPNKEIIVIDGKSTDTTVGIIKKYAQHITYWVSESDDGIYDAMNKGIGAATGDWLYFIGSDDILYDNKVLIDIFSDPNLIVNDIIYGDVVLMSSAERYDGLFDTDKIYEKNICHQAIFTHKRVFEKIGKFDLRYKVWADYAFNIRWFNRRDVKHVYTNRIICLYNDRGYSSLTEDLDLLLAKENLFKEEQYPIKVSIIINFSRDIHLIKSCIDNILKQSYNHLEIIAIIDHTIHANDEWINQWDFKNNKLIVVHNKQTNESSTALWNDSIKAAKGQYVWLLEPSFTAYKNLLHELVLLIDSSVENSLLYCTSAEVEENVLIYARSEHIHLEKKICKDKPHALELIKYIEANFCFSSRTHKASAVLFKKKTYSHTSNLRNAFNLPEKDLLWPYLFLVADLIYLIKKTDDCICTLCSASKKQISTGKAVEELSKIAAKINSKVPESPKFRSKAIHLLLYMWRLSIYHGNISIKRNKNIYRSLKSIHNKIVRTAILNIMKQMSTLFRNRKI